MIKKGIISKFDDIKLTAEVVIPELDNIVTPMIPISRAIERLDLVIGRECVVALFSESFADGAVIAIIY